MRTLPGFGDQQPGGQGSNRGGGQRAARAVLADVRPVAFGRSGTGKGSATAANKRCAVQLIFCIGNRKRNCGPNTT